MWQLALDAWSFKENLNAEPRLQRHVVVLRDEGVEFIVVGAYALAAHGLPRATGDIDIWVRNRPDNAQMIIQALKNLGRPSRNSPKRILSLLIWLFRLG